MSSFENTPGENNWVFTTDVQVESLLNEMRGNLLEYLLAWNLAKHFKILKKFEAGQDSELSKQFATYQSYILQKFPDLPTRLRKLSLEVMHELLDRMPSELKADISIQNLKDIKVVGKVSGRVQNESDILLFTQKRTVGLSLKMMHTRGFVNTKSGGAQSFILKYFGALDIAENLQFQFNQAIQMDFDQLVRNVCQNLEIPFENIETGDWKEYLASKLPGQQNPEIRKMIHQCYNKMANHLYYSFQELYTADKNRFMHCLISLYGLSDQNLYSVLCFYDQEYSLNELEVLGRDELMQELEKMEIQPEAPTKSSFEIYSDRFILQVRIKPMNEFTVPSYKVNCSLKVR